MLFCIFYNFLFRYRTVIVACSERYCLAACELLLQLRCLYRDERHRPNDEEDSVDEY